MLFLPWLSYFIVTGGGLVAKSCPTLLQPHGLLPTRLLCPWDFPGRILEWFAISFSRGSSQPKGQPESPALQEDSLLTELPGKHIFTEAISNYPLLFPSSILGTFQLRGLIFQCHIFLPFHTVHGVLQARILEWVVISFTCGLHFVRILQYDLSILGGPVWHGS